MESVDIESIPLLAGLSPNERARVASAVRPEHFDVGQVIVNEGEFSFDFYALKRGGSRGAPERRARG